MIKTKKYHPLRWIVSGILLLIAIPIYVVGWLGLKEKISYEAGSCAVSYTHYYEDPFLKDAFCPTGESYDNINKTCTTTYLIHPEYKEAELELEYLRCLCANEQEAADLVTLYAKIRRQLIIYKGQESANGTSFLDEGRDLKETTDAKEICEELSSASVYTDLF